MRILVGVDRSEASAAALDWADRFAAAVHASEVITASVFSPESAEMTPERYDELRAAAEGKLDSWASSHPAGTVPHRALLLEGSADALLDAAKAQDAQLLVVGPRGHGEFPGVRIGSLAHHLIHHADRPIAVVPSPGATAGFTRIVVGVDGSEGSAHAVRWTAHVADALNAEVVAVYAFEPLVEWVRESDPRSWRQRADRELEEWVQPLSEAGVKVRTKLVEDIHPVAALASVIDEEEAGLAVVGSRGIGGFLGLRIGRVPIQLVHHSQVPLVMIPPPIGGREWVQP